jgi:hypothetical protein
MAIAENELIAERPRGALRRVAISLGVVLGLILLYYVGGAVWVHEIDDDPTFGAETVVSGNASRAVAVAADLVDREVEQNRWVANDPFFQPGYVLDNMPSYQSGIVNAVGRFTTELRDRVARVRGSSAVDPDLESAAGRLNYPGDVWIFEWSGTPVQPSSESQYRRGVEDLRRYNERLAQGRAIYERRADNLLATLDRISDDLGAASAALTVEVDEGSTHFLDLNADNLFYSIKGKLYAYYLILRELEQDFAGVVREKNLQANWADLLTSLRLGATLYPWIVSNGPLDSMATPNHLAAEGFLLLRVRTKLEEIIDILRT